MHNIAEKAGHSVPGMFHYFSSKEMILYETMTIFADNAYKKIMEIYNVDIDRMEKLGEICKFYVEQYVERTSGEVFLRGILALKCIDE